MCWGLGVVCGGDLVDRAERAGPGAHRLVGLCTRLGIFACPCLFGLKSGRGAPTFPDTARSLAGIVVPAHMTHILLHRSCHLDSLDSEIGVPELGIIQLSQMS